MYCILSVVRFNERNCKPNVHCAVHTVSAFISSLILLSIYLTFSFFLSFFFFSLYITFLSSFLPFSLYIYLSFFLSPFFSLYLPFFLPFFLFSLYIYLSFSLTVCLHFLASLSLCMCIVFQSRLIPVLLSRAIQYLFIFVFFGLQNKRQRNKEIKTHKEIQKV